MLWFVIGSAVLVSIGRLLAPYADTFRPAVERFLARALNQPVRIERIEASWPRLSPRITMHGLEVGDPDQRLLDVDRARLEFKLYNLVQPGRNSLELIVLGLNVVLVQNEQGRWSWRLDRGGRFAEGWEELVSAGDVLLQDSSVRVAPHGLPGLDWQVPEARLDRNADRLTVRLEAMPAGGVGESLEARLILDMPGSRLESISGFARSSSIALSQLAFDTTATGVDDLRAQMQWWAEWSRSEGARFHGQVDLHSLAEGGIAGRMSSHFALDGTWGEDELRVELNAREFGADKGDQVLIDRLAYGTRAGHHGLTAEHIELDYLHALMQPWLGFFDYWPDRLAGTAAGFEIGVNASGALFAARGQFDRLGLALARPEFALSIERLDLGLAGDRLQLRPDGPVRLELPALYPEALEFDRVHGTAGIRPDLVDVTALALEHAELDMMIDGRVQLGEDVPMLDLVVDLPRLEPDSPRRWLPQRGIGPNTRKWLEEALQELGSAQAVTTLFGRPTTWPSHVPDGAVNSRISFSGLQLAYAPGWPIAEQIAGTVEFSGESMHAVVDDGRVADVALRAPEIRIAETRSAEIELDLVSIDSGADDLSRLARALPLGNADRALQALKWSGPATAQASVWLPVKHRDDWRLAGAIFFESADMTVREPEISLAEISGELPFTRERMGPATLSARMLDEPVELSLDSWFQPEFSLGLMGRLPLRGLLPAGWKSSLPDALPLVGGSADFDIEFAGGTPGVRDGLQMRVASSLEGVHLDLPMPLQKPAAEAWPFELVLPLGEALRPARFRVEDRFAARWLVTSDYWQLGLGLGGAEVDLPVAENFIVEGNLAALEIDQWLGLLAGATERGLEPDTRESELSGWLDVTVDDLRVQQDSLGEMALALNREDDYWRLNGAGERARGSMRFPASGEADRSLVVDMQHLLWPAAGRDESAAPGVPSSVDPRRLPALDVLIRQLQWGDLDLGEFRLNSHRDSRGLQIEQVSTQRKGLELNGSGEWRWIDSQPRSEMRLRLGTDNLGQTLKAAGFDVALQRGQAVIEMDGEWPGSPIDLSLQRVEGNLELVVTDGVIPEAGPGAGRVLGLISLNSIPRRLRLDFSDVFGDGLAFDRVAGRFELSGGIASTDDLRIDAPAAEVRMRGRTNLEERTYDQALIVRPGVGSALPVIGALAGGPVGAAAGAALQQIFSKPLGGISEVRYSVTGSWQNPVIEPVAVEPAGDGNG